MKVRFKVWLEKDELPLLSMGKYHLLKEVEKTGSIKAAAENLGLPYKKAHLQLKLLEERLGYRILKRERGKGTVLTEEGKKLLELYGEILKKFQQLAEELEKNFLVKRKVEG
ncbi:MAG: ModE family transcriptional regulator [Gammaproteobacteria bacterium]|nr:MAG: ModE family transcriptional regulator [Gammaproteobacteria bacterium]RTZ68887.1 MAG: ModE family transcriptional regulator [Aquificaceae bacterium]